MSTLRAVSVPREGPAETLRALEGALPDLPPADLMDLAGAAARLAALAGAELSRRASLARPGPGSPPRLLVAKEVADLLRLSPSEVYRRAKTDLKPATINLGPGTLRFDPRGIEKFIASRRE